MTAGLSHEIAGHGNGTCPGLISGSMMHNADSTSSPSGGGALTATHSWMICGKHRESATTCPGGVTGNPGQLPGSFPSQPRQPPEVISLRHGLGFFCSSPVPGPAVSLIHRIIQGVFAVRFLVLFDTGSQTRFKIFINSSSPTLT
jgi:hypothetical protein